MTSDRKGFAFPLAAACGGVLISILMMHRNIAEKEVVPRRDFEDSQSLPMPQISDPLNDPQYKQRLEQERREQEKLYREAIRTRYIA